MDKGSANGVRRWRFRWSNRWPIKARRTHVHTRPTDYYNTYMPGRVRTKVQRRTREIIAYTNQEPRDRLINVARSFLSLPRNSLLNRACISMRNLHVTRSRNAERARASTLFMVCFSCSLIKPIATESARVLRAAADRYRIFNRSLANTIDLSFIGDDFVWRSTPKIRVELSPPN